MQGDCQAYFRRDRLPITEKSDTGLSSDRFIVQHYVLSQRKNIRKSCDKRESENSRIKKSIHKYHFRLY